MVTNNNRNPNLEIPPDFRAPGYAPIRLALITQHQDDENPLDEDGAAQQLLDAWEAERQDRQATWDERVAEEERTREETEAENRREEEEARRQEEKKKKSKFPPLVLGVPPPKDSISRPYQHAIDKLRDLEFVELWFFSFAGCQAAKNDISAEDNDALSITQEGGNIQLKRSSVNTSWKHLLIPDDQLSWKDLLQARNTFLEWMAKTEWPQLYLIMFTNFYCQLELRNELHQSHGHGEKILILYHARARRAWYDALKAKELFDISVFQEEWMSQAHKEVWDRIHMQEIRKFQDKVA